MKITLIFLSFYLIFKFISSLETFNSNLNQSANDASNIHDSASHLQELAHQQYDQLNNPNIVHDQSDDATNQINDADPLNPSHLRGGPYQEQPHSHNETSSHEKTNAVNNKNDRVRVQRGKKQPQHHLQTTVAAHYHVHPFNNEGIHPKFRPLFQSPLELAADASNLNIPRDQSLLEDGQAIINTTKSSDLLQILSAKDNGVQSPRRVSFGDNFYQEKIRSFLFGHHHDKGASHTRSNIKTGLR
jgi:hypothetical protein